MKNSFSKIHFFYLSVISILLNVSSLPIYADTISEQQECLISVALLNKSKQKNNHLFIDIRNNQTFNKKHILGSINIPLELITTKSFLKNKNIVLVGNGWDESSLLDKCAQLKSKGFTSVRVLTGGIISWFLKQHKVSKRSLISVSSKEFFNVNIEKKFVPVVILDKNISNKEKINIKAVLPHAKIVSLKTTRKQLLNRFNRLGKGNNPIVIFSDSMSTVDEAINHYHRNPLRQMYYFEGGFDTYQKVTNLNKMTALSNQKKRLSTKKPVSCAN